MKLFLLTYLTCLFGLFSNGQKSLAGTWQGVITRAGTSIEKGNLIYTSFTISDGKLSGLTREEVYDTKLFSIKKINGSISESQVSFDQFVEIKSSKSSQVKWCRVKADLTYNPKTGYLSGDFVSTDCKRTIGTVILFRSDFELLSEESIDVSHNWFNQFITDYNEGLNAPEIRKIERDNFVFEPIFFDYDKSEIRPEHYDFLNRMIKVIKGHSDLRVKVTGNTDADGSDEYNDGLSKRRAEAIIQYFVGKGLSRDRLEIDFKGEKNPVDTNKTPEGKQRNRRVDFEFI